MDDLGYVEKALDKITIYAQNDILPGKNLILTYETAQTPLNQRKVKPLPYISIGQRVESRFQKGISLAQWFVAGLNTSYQYV